MNSAPDEFDAFEDDTGRPPRRAAKSDSSSKIVIIIVAAVIGVGMLLVCCPIGIAILLPAVQSAREAARRTQSMNNLKQMGIALHNYHDSNRVFPAGGTFDEEGRGLQSWQTALLPFLDQASLAQQIHPDLPWNDPANAAAYQTTLPVFINPSEPSAAPVNGYGVSHYAGNRHVFPDNNGLRFAEFRDGTSNTLLGGEVAEAYKAWGDPTNTRDPALGIGRSAEQFGRSTGAGGCVLLFADGSVRWISDAIDMETMRRLALPDDGEAVDFSSFETSR